MGHGRAQLTANLATQERGEGAQRRWRAIAPLDRVVDPDPFIDPTKRREQKGVNLPRRLGDK